jgi:Flp pilus assembly protein TadG
MKDLIKRLGNSKKGAIGVEFAFVFPIVLLFTFGFFEFCRVVYIQNIIDYSTAQGARFAMISFDTTSESGTYLAAKEAEIEAFTLESLNLIDNSKISSFDITIGALDAGGTRNVSIEIDYDFSTFMPFLSQFTYTITSKSESFLAQGI